MGGGRMESCDGLVLLNRHPGEVTPHTRTDSITDRSSLLVLFFSCVFFSSFIRKCFVAEVAAATAPLRPLEPTTNRLGSFSETCAGVLNFFFFSSGKTDVTIVKRSGVGLDATTRFSAEQISP